MLTPPPHTHTHTPTHNTQISIRFVPEQDSAHLISALRAHVQSEFARLGSGNSVAVHVHSVGDWWEADPESDIFQMAERAVRR